MSREAASIHGPTVLTSSCSPRRHARAGHELNDALHVGMYAGDGQIVESANPTDGTIIAPLSDYTVLGYSDIMIDPCY